MNNKYNHILDYVENNGFKALYNIPVYFVRIILL